ncbi:MAG: hypothetical protein GX616_20140 [Planctomycetes bacterium]|nr:hypothetical protein [Planctomycetota bacterium]
MAIAASLAVGVVVLVVCVASTWREFACIDEWYGSPWVKLAGGTLTLRRESLDSDGPFVDSRKAIEGFLFRWEQETLVDDHAVQAQDGGILILSQAWSRNEVFIRLWRLLPVTLIYPTVCLLSSRYRRYSRRKRGCCANCGYDLTGNVSGVCPECGQDV